jgi:hypothetical protein
MTYPLRALNSITGSPQRFVHDEQSDLLVQWQNPWQQDGLLQQIDSDHLSYIYDQLNIDVSFLTNAPTPASETAIKAEDGEGVAPQETGSAETIPERRHCRKRQGKQIVVLPARKVGGKRTRGSRNVVSSFFSSISIVASLTA